MLVKCNTEGCKNYNVLIENNLDESGAYNPQCNRVCPECGKERIDEVDDGKCSWAIDELALGTKRFGETSVRKYK